MNYSPVQHHHTQSREFKTARLSQRGIWISLMQYCTSQENNGIITNITDWKPSEIRKTLNIDPLALEKPSPLWTIKNNNLHIYGYPHDKQAILNAKRRTLATNTGTQPAPQTPRHTAPPAPSQPASRAPNPTPATHPIGYYNFLRHTCVMDAWRNKPLNQREETAALQAWQQTLTCSEYDWQLLAACYKGYYKHGQKMDKSGNKYYCPASRLKLYEDIIDVLTKTHLWKQDTRWKPKPAHTPNPPPPSNLAIPPPQTTLTVEQIRAEFSELHQYITP